MDVLWEEFEAQGVDLLMYRAVGMLLGKKMHLEEGRCHALNASLQQGKIHDQLDDFQNANQNSYR